MPNQRSKSKDYISGWVDLRLKKKVTAAAKSDGVPLSEWVKQAVEHALDAGFRASRPPS